MAVPRTRSFARQLSGLVLIFWMLAGAPGNLVCQNKKGNQAGNETGKEETVRSAPSGAGYSGMYGFLKDGEFVQVTVEDQGRVTGFISRYGDSESDRGVFLDHFFKSGKLDGNQLSFTTDAVHGVSYDFRGTVERGEGKNAGDEAYYVLKGTLVENTIDQSKKTTSDPSAVVFKGFPRDMAPPVAEKK
jgi:hypothetical protein